MADTKITGLTEQTSVSSEDLLVIVDDPGGSPVTKKITVANLQAGIVTGSARITITDDSVFKASGTAIDFGNGLNVAVTGSTVFVSSQSSSEGSYYQYLAASLEPDAIETMKTGTSSYVIGANETKLLSASWATRLGSSGRMEVRDPSTFMPLRDTTITGLHEGSVASIINPATGTYTNARDTYFERLQYLADASVKYLVLSGASDIEPFLPGPYGSIITSVTIFDYAWIILKPSDSDAGFNLGNEVADTTIQRIFNKLNLPVSKNIGSIIKSSNHDGLGSITYVQLPSTWSKVTDSLSPYDFRDDFMGSSLATGTVWGIKRPDNDRIKIDTQYNWLKASGTNAWDVSGMFSVDSINKADGKAFLADVYVPSLNLNGHLMIGFHDGAGYTYSDLVYGINFGGSGLLSVYENGNNRGAVGSGYSANTIYRIRITCTSGNEAVYEIQGGIEYPPIRGSIWSDITPGTTSSVSTELHAGIAVYGGIIWVGDIRMY